MQWHFEDIPLLMHSLPRALHDLMQHEDKDIVSKGVKSLSLSQPPLVSIEKTLDPMAQRSAQNIGLLLHDYIKQLPSFDVSHAEGEKLLEHWREIMTEQPQRLAVAHQSHWHDESSKAFWHDKIASHHADLGVTSDSFPDAWDDWQRASGIGHNINAIKQLPAMKQKQWQDLVIRSRLHNETMMRWKEG
jgi:hypothetical protein